VVHRRGEHFPDGSPKRQQPDGLAAPQRQGQGERPVGITQCTFQCHSSGLDPATCWARAGAFFLLPAMQATSTLLRSGSTRQRKAGPVVRQLVLFSLPEPIGSCWDLICPEEAWEQPLRWAV
jgi:hypothetical protein